MTAPTPDHYEVLGVARNATPEEIKAAYRKKSSAYHPDRAEPDEKDDCAAMMVKVNAANDVLSDPERRARYDATGNGDVDRTDAEAGALLASMFTRGLGGTDESVDLVRWVRIQLREQVSQATEEISKGKYFIGKLQRRRPTVARKSTGAANVVHHLIDARVREIQTSIARNERVIVITNTAIAQLDDYEFIEPPEAPGFAADRGDFIDAALLRLSRSAGAQQWRTR